MDNARIAAFEQMAKAPLQFLGSHFKLTPESPREEIIQTFTRFGEATGKSEVAIAFAVDSYVNKQQVADFVKQAASAEKTANFVDSA